MASEQVLSCYLVRMRQKHTAIYIEVQDVRSGRIECFESMEDFLTELSKRFEQNGLASRQHHAPELKVESGSRPLLETQEPPEESQEVIL